MRLFRLFGGNRRRCRFVIVTRERSGSYHLTRMLNSADDIVCHGEVFKPAVIEVRRRFVRRLGMTRRDTKKRDADPLDFVNRLTALTWRQTTGFKAFCWHLAQRPPLLEGVLLSTEWRKLFLFRNPLEVYVSARRAKQTGRWIVPEKKRAAVSDEVLSAAVTYTGESFETSIAQWRQLNKQYERAMDACPEQVLRIGYEELGSPGKLQDVLGFLGSSASATDLDSGLVKQYGGRFRDGIANWDDFEAHVRRLGFERYLEGLAD